LHSSAYEWRFGLFVYHRAANGGSLRQQKERRKEKQEGEFRSHRFLFFVKSVSKNDAAKLLERFGAENQKAANGRLNGLNGRARALN
jgi:hypothetical protein